MKSKKKYFLVYWKETRVVRLSAEVVAESEEEAIKLAQEYEVESDEVGCETQTIHKATCKLLDSEEDEV